jgi:membrane protein
MERLDKFAERRPWLRVILDVQKRFGELHGNNLSASIVLQAFLSIFPLLLVVIAVVGFFSASGHDLAGRLIGQLGLNGDAARAVSDAMHVAERSRRVASVIGVAGLFWSGLGLVDALQYGYDQVWQVKARGIKDKAFGMLWLLGAAVVISIGGGFTWLVNRLPGFLAPLAILAAVVVNCALFLWTEKVLPNRNVGWRALIPGAVMAGVGLEALKAIGGFWVPRLVASSSALYGSIGIVFAILAWLLLFSRLLVYSAVLNVVLYERRHGTEQKEIEVPRLPDAQDVDTEATRTGRVATARN